MLVLKSKAFSTVNSSSVFPKSKFRTKIIKWLKELKNRDRLSFSFARSSMKNYKELGKFINSEHQK